MSIYATQWILRFPAHGQVHSGCEWVELVGQGVPAHIGTPTPGYGYETGDPYSEFLPPAIPIPQEDDEAKLRAIVIVRRGTEKTGQEFVDPLLVLTGAEYASLSFGELHDRICDALATGHPRCVSERYHPDGTIRLTFNDGSTRDVKRPLS